LAGLQAEPPAHTPPPPTIDPEGQHPVEEVVSRSNLREHRLYLGAWRCSHDP
jgi:hypothetical protein